MGGGYTTAGGLHEDRVIHRGHMETTAQPETYMSRVGTAKENWDYKIWELEEGCWEAQIPTSRRGCYAAATAFGRPDSGSGVGEEGAGL